MGKWIKTGFIILLVIYFGLYLSYRNGYYINKNSEKAIYTEEAIREYEEDLKRGIDVSKKSYLKIKEDYQTPYTKLTLKISKKIENGFTKIIKYIFNRVGREINK